MQTTGAADGGGDMSGGDTIGGDSSGGDSSGGDSGDMTSGGMSGDGSEEPTMLVLCNAVSGETCVGGRGHEALRSHPAPRSADALGRWLARMAHSEHASVVAFLALADELEAHEAPADLVTRCRAAARDEVAHAQSMARLARARGAAVPTPRFDRLEIRELVTIAVENAVEGCVRETWAALEASYQARAAGAPELRRAMEVIAVDETRHATLSHDIDRWLRSRLDEAAVARVERARRRAVVALQEAIEGQGEGPERAMAGLLPRSTALRLHEQLRQHLWA